MMKTIVIMPGKGLYVWNTCYHAREGTICLKHVLSCQERDYMSESRVIMSGKGLQVWNTCCQKFYKHEMHPNHSDNNDDCICFTATTWLHISQTYITFFANSFSKLVLAIYYLLSMVLHFSWCIEKVCN